MTSGQFHLISTDSILVERDERQRRELTDIHILADSIRRLGLIHPLVITRDFVLVAGERRLAACRSIGLTQVSIQFVDEVEPHVLKEIELEENIKRTDIPWQDMVRSVGEYHALRGSLDPSWTRGKTAEAIGLSPARITELLNVAEEMAAGNERVLEAPRLSTAEGIVKRAIERKDAQVLQNIMGSMAMPTGIPEEPESILTANFNTWLYESFSGPLFNFIHCDFPYGIDADSFNQGAAPAHGGYEDSPEVWEALMASLSIFTKRMTTPSCHLMFWFSMRKGSKRLYEPTIQRLESMGWEINPLPLVWMKSDGVGIIPDPQRGPRQIYETCLFGSKGDRKIVSAVANAYHSPSVRDRHMSEKPEAMLKHFFRMFVDENTILFDPTCGSGSSIRAAECLGAKYTLGLELNPEFAEIAREELTKARKLRKAA